MQNSTTLATTDGWKLLVMLVGIGPCIPIADIRDVDTLEYDKGEKLFRCKLAALYRLVDLFGWSRGIQSYITVSFLETHLLEFLTFLMFLVSMSGFC